MSDKVWRWVRFIPLAFVLLVLPWAFMNDHYKRLTDDDQARCTALLTKETQSLGTTDFGRFNAESGACIAKWQADIDAWKRLP